MSLSTRQRTAPPMDRWSTRRGESSGGRDTADPRTLAPGLETELTRYPGTVFDGQIRRDRGPYYQRAMYLPPPVTWVNWTAAGPPRPELHMRCATLRTMVGNSQARFPTVDSPSNGMHTMIPGATPGGTQTQARYLDTSQMTAARINRLASSQYSGQTYSQTTVMQGRGGRRK